MIQIFVSWAKDSGDCEKILELENETHVLFVSPE